MAAKTTIVDLDHGYRKVIDRLVGASKSRPVVRIGVQSNDGAEPHAAETFTAKQTKSAKFVKKHGALADLRGVAGGRVRVANDNDKKLLTVLEVAIINEFGSADGKRPPARSFLRAWFDENRSTIGSKLNILMRSVVRGERTKEQVLELIGQWCVGQIQLRIARGIAPANAASTIKRKGSSKPLIDTGVLRSSISYRVDDS